MLEVKLAEFLRIVGEVFPNQNVEEGQRQYDECLGHHEIWDNLSDVDENAVRTIVIRFLNKWQCRLPYECAPQLAIALRKVEPLLQPLRGHNIESTDLLTSINIEGRTSRILKLIEEAFDSIQRIRAGRRTVAFTATSKILHMAIPKFFVMSDEKIRKTYGCDSNAVGYGNFMFRMSLLARDLISQAQGNKEMILNCSKWKGRTLAQLLDNFNYTRFTLKKA